MCSFYYSIEDLMHWGKKQWCGKGDLKMEEENKNVETGAEGEVMTFDEILADKHYQSEFDKKVAKALETAKTKWEQEAEVKRTEAEKLAKMDAEEKHKYQLEQANQERDTALSKLNAYELKEVAQQIASEKGVPYSLLKVIDFTKENADSIKTKIEEIEIVYKQSVQDGINDRMKEKTPKTVIGSVSTDDDLDQWRKDAEI